jgi:hypothetical protein
MTARFFHTFGAFPQVGRQSRIGKKDVIKYSGTLGETSPATYQ